MESEFEAALPIWMAFAVTALGGLFGALIMWIAFRIRDYFTPNAAADAEKEALLPKSAAEDTGDCDT